MKRVCLAKQGLGLSAFCIITTTVHAGMPVWSFSPNGSPQVSVSATGTATVSYIITNNSKKPHRLVLSSNTPAGISQSGGPCVLMGKSPANPNPTCLLTLNINGSALPADDISGGPSLCQVNDNDTPNPSQCYQPSSEDTLVITRTTAPGATTLSTSIVQPSILALSVKNTQLNAQLTGNERYITIKNTGINPATGLSVLATGLPSGTSITTTPTTCTGTLAPKDTCTVTITPGAEATSDCNTGSAPTSGTITVRATNVATPVISNVVVLNYGCQYQGGFLYSIDDSTSQAGSIGGKVAALTDQFSAPTSPQSATPNWGGYGCDIGPKLWSNDTQGANDGSTNSSAIVSALTTKYFSGPCSLSSPVNKNNYAAGRCSQYTTPSDAGLKWYLPSICELSGESPDSNCTSGTTSMLNQLWLLNPAVGGFVDEGYYWSSTEIADSLDAQYGAWYQQFSLGGFQDPDRKDSALGVRCSRALSL